MTTYLAIDCFPMYMAIQTCAEKTLVLTANEVTEESLRGNHNLVAVRTGNLHLLPIVRAKLEDIWIESFSDEVKLKNDDQIIMAISHGQIPAPLDDREFLTKDEVKRYRIELIKFTVSIEEK